MFYKKQLQSNFSSKFLVSTKSLTCFCDKFIHNRVIEIKYLKIFIFDLIFF